MSSRPSNHAPALRGHLASCLATLALLLSASTGHALVHASGDPDDFTSPPADDPGWANVGRRLGGPTAVYLGNGWGITAAHVGVGVVVFDGQRYDGISESYKKLVDRDGRSADLMIFRIAPGENGLPDLPILPIRTSPPRPGEELILMGVGLIRDQPTTESTDERRVHKGFTLKEGRVLRWGTNRAADWPGDVKMGDDVNRAIPMVFLPPEDRLATAHEAHAAMGDSGGAVFALRNPDEPSQGWALAGILSNVSSVVRRPDDAKTPRAAYFGDVTMALDLSYYREQIIATARPECSNELDDDGDGRIDYPHDKSCKSMASQKEGNGGRPKPLPLPLVLAASGAVLMVLIVALGIWWLRRLPRIES